MAHNLLERIFGLGGKVALVTGAGRGIGRALAIGLAGAGADVALAARSHGDLVALAGEIEALGRRASVHRIDLADAAAVDRLADEVVASLGRLDILVNNAGISVHEPVLAMSAATGAALTAVNLDAPVALSTAAVRHMIAQGSGGKVINITSLAAFRGFADHAGYSMTKAALAAFSRTLASELARADHDIQVNCIAPGAVVSTLDQAERESTDPAAAAVFARRADRVMSLIPASRPALAEEMQGLVILLASRASSYITGQDMVIDGGWSSDSGWPAAE